jgi:hypothetical protein
MKIAVVVLATNSYSVLGLRFMSKWLRYYSGVNDVTLYYFGDFDPRPYLPDGAKVEYRKTTHYSWEAATNSKFISILSLNKELFDFLIYVDADTDIIKPFDDAWFLCDGLMGLQHYGDMTYMQNLPKYKPFERNKISKAYIPEDSTLPQMYYAGAFFGGNHSEILRFCETLRINQRTDKLKKYEACVNDESHINWFFHFYPPTKTVPADAYPFVISDKAGFSNVRVYIDHRPLLKKIQENRNSDWILSNRNFALAPVPVIA